MDVGQTEFRAPGAESVIERERRALRQIAAGIPLATVLDELLRAVEANASVKLLASVLLLSSDGRHLRHGAAPSLPQAYNEAIDGIEIGEGVGSCGTAAQRGEPVYVADIANDPLWKDFRDLALSHGLQACWSTPIRSADNVLLGTFAIYYPKPREPTQIDLDAIAAVAQTIALAIERHLSDRTLRENEARLRLLTEELEAEVATRTRERDRLWSLSRDPFLVADRDGRWLSVSPVWTELLGWSESELVGKTSEWMEHPDDRARTRTEVEALSEGGPTLRFENRFRALDGSYRIFSWTAVPEGEFLYCVARDVTVEREQQAELEKAQAALRQAQKMEAVGQLTGGIAHDFNNLLTVIIGNVDMARRILGDSASARVQRVLGSASMGAERAAALTQRLLAFSRRQPLQPKAVDANKLVGGMSELLARALGETIAFQVVKGAGLWRVEADPNQLESAILNLAVNARDAMPNGGMLTIEIANVQIDEGYAESHLEVASGRYVVIAVSDTGAGMSREILDQVFDPFFTTKDVGKGTGLGLSQVYGFVKQSGGHVGIYSEVGQGTTVKIYLPRIVAEVEAGDAIQCESIDSGVASERIFVVEDDDDVRTFTVESLRNLGYTVIEAPDGAAALQVLDGRETSIDLLLTDVVMPGMSGRELADEARRRQPDLKVLFTTGYARNAIVHGGRLDPGVELLPKPFSYPALAAKVRDLLDNGPTERLLLVVSDPAFHAHITEQLNQLGFKSDRAMTTSEALGKVRAKAGRYDIVLLDDQLPGLCVDAFVAELHAVRAGLPVLITSLKSTTDLTRHFEDHACVAAIEKPFESGRLRECLARLHVSCETH